MVLGQCVKCGMVQLIQTIPFDEIRARFDWLLYDEPEDHLDDLVQLLSRLPGIKSDSLIGSIGFGRDSTLDRFERRGFNQTWRLDLWRDLGVSHPNARVETIQEKLTSHSARWIAKQRGLSDLLIVRHMLEHTHDLRNFLEGIKLLVKPTGYVIFEVPDCEKPFADCDYSILWEEHVFYFMPETLRFSLEKAGFEILDLQRPPHSLIAIARPIEGLPRQEVLPPQILAQEQLRLLDFTNSFPKKQQQAVDLLVKIRAAEGKIAFFGAGHLACVYINLFQLKDYIEFVTDDHPKKRGLFMPGSHLPIYNSSALIEHDIRVCLMALRPQTERKLAKRNPDFFTKGGRFISILPGRANSLLG